MKKTIALFFAVSLFIISISGKPLMANDRLDVGAVVFIIDDGERESTLAAVEILQKHGFHITIAVVTDWIGKPGHLTVSDLQKLYLQGCEIANHTTSHKYFSKMTDDEIFDSIEKASDAIVSWGLPRPVTLIPPGGDFGEGEKVDGIRLKNIIVGTSIMFVRQAYPQDIEDMETIVNRVDTFNPMSINGISFRKETMGIDPLNLPDIFFYDPMYNVREEGALAVFILHGVTNNTEEEYNITPEMLEKIILYILKQYAEYGKDVDVMTMAEAGKMMLAAKEDNIGTVDEIDVESVINDPTIPVSEVSVSESEEVTDSGNTETEISVSGSESRTESGEAISESGEVVSDSETTSDEEEEGDVSLPENIVVTGDNGGGSGGCFISAIK